ncbi:hypothetical protein QBZ16_005377 [Prototheca wickerhamii]|uniref:E2F/DP family winged-helix DNA-binding domain-containing protein n=1 Tax=Prototheca wickerhamii TaxID=3111 RepID=A0AAD9II59_PROWI|nr:hypothetical protein QBZ16_005377 [Prototheca wickerhamii]
MAPGGSGRPEGYSRKAKSLSLLCENFITRFGLPESVISLDGSAKALGVERRRIYDIVNVLESVKVVTKVQKNQYTWHGMDRLGPALEELRAEAEAELAEVGASGAEGLLTLDERKEKSMTRLSQRFVQMFMLSKSKALGLDEAARALLGGTEDAGLFKTKVRRLYDIANILSALHLIEKAHVGEKGKPGFRWLGPEAVMAAAQRSSEEAAAARRRRRAHTLESAGEDAAAVAALHAHFQRTQQPMLPQHASAAAAAAAAAAALWNGAAAGAGADPLALAQLQQLQQSLPMVGTPRARWAFCPGQGAPGGATQLAGAPARPGGAPGRRRARRGARR